jgi:hypothetical protein
LSVNLAAGLYGCALQAGVSNSAIARACRTQGVFLVSITYVWRGANSVIITPVFTTYIPVAGMVANFLKHSAAAIVPAAIE